MTSDRASGCHPLARRIGKLLALGVTLARLAVGLEPPSVPDAAGTVSPNPLTRKFGSPAGPALGRAVQLINKELASN